MKHVKLYEEFAKVENEKQTLIDELKNNAIKLDGKEYLLNQIIINLLDSIWAKEKNFNAYSLSNYETAKENIKKYLE
jgi:hypothetical protein